MTSNPLAIQLFLLMKLLWNVHAKNFKVYITSKRFVVHIEGKNSDKFNLPIEKSCWISSARFLPMRPSRELPMDIR